MNMRMIDKIIEIIEQHKDVPYRQGKFILTHSWAAALAVDIYSAFEKRLREELIKYNTFLYEHSYTDTDIWAEEPNPADEYLKLREK